MAATIIDSTAWGIRFAADPDGFVNVSVESPILGGRVCMDRAGRRERAMLRVVVERPWAFSALCGWARVS